MTLQNPRLDVVGTRARCCNMSTLSFGLLGGLFGGIALSVLLGGAFFLGRSTNPGASEFSPLVSIPNSRMHPDLLSASATHGGANMAVCTAQVDENAEGFFTLDFITGDLKGWVYYPRLATFGGLFITNVQPALGMSKNPEYLLVSGNTAPTRGSGNSRSAQSLVYVVDTRSGMFAAYTIPWNSTMESSGAGQMGQFVLIGGDKVREAGLGVKKAVSPPNIPKPAAGNAAPGNPDPAADPNKPGAPAVKDPKKK